MPKPPHTVIKRRRFVTLVALSGAALVVEPLSRAAAAVSRGAGTGASRRTPSPAVRREIANQQKSLAEQLATIRRYELPPGSPMAFAFTPLRAPRGR